MKTTKKYRYFRWVDKPGRAVWRIAEGAKYAELYGRRDRVCFWTLKHLNTDAGVRECKANGNLLDT